MTAHTHNHHHDHDHHHHKILSPEVEQQVRDFFGQELDKPIRVVYFTGGSDCMYCDLTQQLLEEVSALDDRIHLTVYDIHENPDAAAKYQVDRVPAIAILAEEDGEEIDYGIRFFGIPAEYEFSSLLQTMAIVSRRQSGLSQPTLKFLESLERPVRLDVFVTPSCPYCPRMVFLAHQMALASPKVRSAMVEAMEFPDWASEYGVSSVPHTVINEGEGMFIGAMPEGMVVEEIRRALAEARV